MKSSKYLELVFLAACSNAFPRRFFLALSTRGGTPSTKQVPFCSSKGADITKGRACTFFACRDGNVRPLGEVCQEAEGVWPTELSRVRGSVPNDRVEEGSGADDESEVKEVLDLFHHQTQQVLALVDAPLEDADVAAAEA